MQHEQQIRQELDRIELALRDSRTSPDKYVQFYAAQQALAWVLTPIIADSPYDVINSGRVHPLMADTPGD